MPELKETETIFILYLIITSVLFLAFLVGSNIQQGKIEKNATIVGILKGNGVSNNLSLK